MLIVSCICSAKIIINAAVLFLGVISGSSSAVNLIIHHLSGEGHHLYHVVSAILETGQALQLLFVSPHRSLVDLLHFKRYNFRAHFTPRMNILTHSSN